MSGDPAQSAQARDRRIIRHWLLDLDDTLYPASTGLFHHVSRRITGRIASLLGLPEDEARRVQRAYWRKYGTSLRGLIVEHGIDPEPFLAHVHDVPVEEILAPDPALRRMLGSLSGERHVFTNGPAEFARRVLTRLGVADQFSRLFDIRHADFIPKPDPHPYRRVLESLGAPGDQIAMVDDSPQNLEPARALGMMTIWLRSPDSMAGGSAGNSVALATDGHRTIDRLLDLPRALAL
ncbi:MAG: pyrimidine 5'-nucleotidase [Candidatus Eiseniibacteriota bacterium]